MKISRIARIAINVLSAIVTASLGVSSSWAQNAAPRYEVDATFPKPFPNRWVTGGFGGHCIDAGPAGPLPALPRPGRRKERQIVRYGCRLLEIPRLDLQGTDVEIVHVPG